jgi:hypothetical protein
MNDKARRQSPAFRNSRLAGRTRRKSHTRPAEGWPRDAMNRAVHPAAATQSWSSGIEDCVDSLCCDVGFDYFDHFASALCVVDRTEKRQILS